ncbi:hypothetical protein [Pedobacter panaciterrae]|jgi:hypothetical protein|uniref:Uncharacterized protein n=1 Tax=Pedobacter panaciterrae TaxID=363849 RepID=A0ABU8NTD6_9SPHI|nr:hypothetical protein [Pedobacter panaciterrae]NQX53412.1 hypothetical protein [Pedobacter panaciterrae]
MKEVTHEYGIELFWKDNLAEQLDGYVDGKYIRGNEYVLVSIPTVYKK